MENNLVENIAKLLKDLVAVTGFDGIDQLVGFFQEVLNQRLVSLLGIPGATAWGSEKLGGANKTLKLLQCFSRLQIKSGKFSRASQSLLGREAAPALPRLAKATSPTLKFADT